MRINITLLSDKLGHLLPQRVSQVFQVNAVVLWNLMRQIAQQGNLKRSQTALLARRIDPCEVREVRVNAARHNLCVDFLELGDTIGKRKDFGWTDESTANRC